MGLHVRRNHAPLPNPTTPYDPQAVEWDGPDPAVPLEIIEERPRSVLAHNDSPDVGFNWSVNPYRGCQHGCVYCYARPTHEYLDMSAGRDFERRIVVKVTAPEVLEREFRTKRSWRGETIAFSGNTDCYQALEAEWRLTRRCLEVCAAFRNPVSIITKAHLVTRDVDVLQDLHRYAAAEVTVSVTFLDRAVARAVEPLASSLESRLAAIRRLADAGISVGVLVAPIIPGLNDADIPGLLAAAREAGATRAAYICLRLPGTLEHVFDAGIRERLPLRAERILARIREVRGGAMNEWRFGKRMVGRGVYWDCVERLFRTQAARLGFDLSEPAPVAPTFRIPDAQQEFAF